MVLTLFLFARGLSAQIAGYSVGTRNLNVRAIACSHTDSGGLVCQPSGDVNLYIRDSALVEIDSTWTRNTTEYMSSPDVWRELQERLIARFGEPDSVRTMNTLKLPPAYSEGLAVFWTKPAWCAVLTVKTGVIGSGVFIPIELTVEKRDAWGGNCSVYPYLENSH
jgi:hypothetical protein